MVTFEIKKGKETKDYKINCPRCSSNNVYLNKRGFSGSNALVGGLFLGPLGLLAGMGGSKRLIGKCLNCGKRFDVEYVLNKKWKQEKQKAKN